MLARLARNPYTSDPQSRFHELAPSLKVDVCRSSQGEIKTKWWMKILSQFGWTPNPKPGQIWFVKDRDPWDRFGKVWIEETQAGWVRYTLIGTHLPQVRTCTIKEFKNGHLPW